MTLYVEVHPMNLTTAIAALSRVQHTADTQRLLMQIRYQQGDCRSIACAECPFNVGSGPCLCHNWSDETIEQAASILLRRYDR